MELKRKDDRVQLTTTDLQDELLFRVVRHASLYDWFYRIVPPALAISTFFIPRFHHDWVFRALIIVSMIGSTKLYWLRGRMTELRVTGDRLIASGNLQDLFSARKSVPASEVDWMGFDSIAGGNPGGFVVDSENGRIRVFPGLNREQSEAIVDAILQRFPSIRPNFPR
jgi:hypothetical protein